MENSKKSIAVFQKKSIKDLNVDNEKFCNYPHRHCLLYPVQGYEYCIQHIMEDKTAPYKQCCYIHNKTGRRCPNAAPKSDKKEGYCYEHRKKVSFLKKQAMKTKRKPVDTLESILFDLERNNEEVAKAEKSSAYPPPKTISNLHLTDVYQSDSDSDKEPIPLEDIFRGDAESDAESLDSDQEDPLKHAGVYTAEEAALIMRDKLIRLQSLYIGQFKRLQHILRERRRKYLKSVKQERETYGSISNSVKVGAELKTYNKLRSLNRYHCKRGKESLMQQQNKEKRLALTEGASYKPPTTAKCVHLEDSIRCTNSPMPFSKFCLKHILHDSHQILFKPCRYADTECNKVIVPFQDDSRCALHLSLSETIEPLVKTLPQGSDSLPKGYPGMMTDIDKFLGDPDQFLSSFPTTFSGGGDSISVTAPSYPQVSQPFGDVPTSVPFSCPMPLSANTSSLPLSTTSVASNGHEKLKSTDYVASDVEVKILPTTMKNEITPVTSVTSATSLPTLMYGQKYISTDGLKPVQLSSLKVEALVSGNVEDNKNKISEV